MEQNRKILIRRRKLVYSIDKNTLADSIEDWTAYWRANIHRFISDYLGLPYRADFQPILIHFMDSRPNFVFAASRGLAKSTITLLYCIARCILYPNTTIIVVAPLRGQSLEFVQKIREFVKSSPNLEKEIEDDGIKTGKNDCGVHFKNGSRIITKTFSEGARGARGQVLIVDEFAQLKDKTILVNTFQPMLTSPRSPAYRNLTKEQRAKLVEPNRQYYLSSIRSEIEWSWEYLLSFFNSMINGDKSYGVLSLSYHLGVRGGYILKENVVQSFKNSPELFEVLQAEYLAVPIRGDTGSFFKYQDIQKDRDHTSAFVCKTDEEYIELKNKPEKWQFYVPKQQGEIRVLSMDIALMESARNDNTSFWLVRLIPNGSNYYKALVYGESMNGINSVVQAKRAKQLFYEFECDYFAVDTDGAGRGVADILTGDIYDEVRGETYPAWTTALPEDAKTLNRTISPNAVPIMYAMHTTPFSKHSRFVLTRDMLKTATLHLPDTEVSAIEKYTKSNNYYKIDDANLRSRMLQTYTEVNMLTYEATNLETVVSNGYYNLKEKPSRRKDRVMSLCYNLDVVNQLEQKHLADLSTPDFSLCDYIFAV